MNSSNENCIYNFSSMKIENNITHKSVFVLSCFEIREESPLACTKASASALLENFLYFGPEN